MVLQWLDVGLIAIMILSGLLALMRGFTRETLSLVAWAAAAAATAVTLQTPEFRGLARQYLQPDVVADVTLGAGVFLIVLIIMSLISVKIADLVLDSAAGPFDRTLGLLYGLLRGLLVVSIAYFLLTWVIPPERRWDGVRNAWSLPIIEKTNDILVQMVISLPFVSVDWAESLQANLRAGRGDGGPQPQNNAPSSDQTGDNESYKPGQQRVLDQLIESTQGKRSTQGVQN